MNVGHEDEELKPYVEPQPDYKDPRRTGRNRNALKNDKCILSLHPRTSMLHADVIFLHSHTKIIYLKGNYEPAGSPPF